MLRRALPREAHWIFVWLWLASVACCFGGCSWCTMASSASSAVASAASAVAAAAGHGDGDSALAKPSAKKEMPKKRGNEFV